MRYRIFVQILPLKCPKLYTAVSLSKNFNILGLSASKSVLPHCEFRNFQPFNSRKCKRLLALTLSLSVLSNKTYKTLMREWRIPAKDESIPCSSQKSPKSKKNSSLPLPQETAVQKSSVKKFEKRAHLIRLNSHRPRPSCPAPPGHPQPESDPPHYMEHQPLPDSHP